MDNNIKPDYSEDIDDIKNVRESLNDLIKTERFTSDDEMMDGLCYDNINVKEEMDIGETVIQQTDFARMFIPIKDEFEVKGNHSSKKSEEIITFTSNFSIKHQGVEEDLTSSKNNSSNFQLYCKSAKLNTRGRYPCHVCDKDFTLITNLKRHYINIHSNHPPTKVICDICTKTYRYKSDLIRHIQCVHSQNEVRKNKVLTVAAICEYCSKTFAAVKFLERHVKTVHLKLCIKCPKCRKWHMNHDNAEKHKLVCLKNDPVYKCDYEMQKHKCEVCDKAYKDQYSLLYHRRQIHQPRTNVVTECIQCKKLYLSKSGLRRHIKNKHTGQNKRNRIVRIDPSGPFNCGKCGKLYNTKNCLYNHINKVCNPGPPVKCYVCKRPFKCDQYMNIHLKKFHPNIYKARQLVQCENCSALFQNKLILITHLRKCIKNP